MNLQEYTEIQKALLSKHHKGSRLKPAQEGFNDGLRKATSALEGMIGKDYETIKSSLLRMRKRGLCTNREEGFNDAILRTVSKVKEIQERMVSKPKESLDSQIRQAAVQSTASNFVSDTKTNQR